MHRICFGALIDGVHVLGPGIRQCLWLQGCARCPKCKGCTSPEYQPFLEERYVKTDFLIDYLLRSNKNRRLTISGGEPLDQATELHRLLEQIRDEYDDILIYTGKELGSLSGEERRAVELADVCIDGEYEEKRNTGCILRGSENQKINYMHRCPEKLKNEYMEYLNQKTFREVEFFPVAQQMVMVGIPG